MTYSIILRSQLEGAKRLDAEYYQPEFLDVTKKLKSIKTKTIGEVSNSVLNFGAYSLCNYINWQKQGVPYLNVENIKDGFVDFDGVKFISEKVNEILKKSQVKEDEVILTMAGTIGNAAVARNLPLKVNSNQATAKISLKEGFSPYFLVAFFGCYYGKKQTEREIVSSVQPNIFLGQIKDFKIPVISETEQKEIEKLYKNGLNELENSKSFYSEAENLLLKELDLENFVNENEDLFSIVNLSDIIENKRMDAEFYQSKFKKMIDKVRGKVKIQKLDELADFRRGIFVPVDFYTEEKTKRPYIRIKELSGKVGVDETKVIYIKDSYKEDKTNEVQENDLIIAIIGDTIGKVNKINEELTGGFCSNNTGIIRIKHKLSEKILPDFFDLLFQSKFIQSQIEKKKAQTGQPKINDKEIKSIDIPILPKQTQQKISDLVKKSFGARKKSKELLDEAKRKVEKMIENN
jgi:restriction endonuclease S subunit